MAEFFVRQAEAVDAAAIIAHIKRIADEPNNGISISAAEDFPYTIAEEKTIISRSADQPDRLMIVAEAEGQIIGVATCKNDDGGYQHCFSLAITVRREWRGQGVGTAMIHYMFAWCKRNPLAHRLELWVFGDNLGAIRLYERLGFQYEGTRRESFFKDGEFKDLILMGMLLES